MKDVGFLLSCVGLGAGTEGWKATDPSRPSLSPVMAQQAFLDHFGMCEGEVVNGRRAHHIILSLADDVYGKDSQEYRAIYSKCCIMPTTYILGFADGQGYISLR